MSDKPVFKPTKDSTTVLIVGEPKGPFDGKFGPQWPCDVSIDGKDMTWWINRQDLANEAKEWAGRKVIVKKVDKINEAGQAYTKIEILGQAAPEDASSKDITLETPENGVRPRREIRIDSLVDAYIDLFAAINLLKSRYADSEEDVKTVVGLFPADVCQKIVTTWIIGEKQR